MALDFKFKGVELLVPTSTSIHHRYFRFHVKSGIIHVGKFKEDEPFDRAFEGAF